MFVDYSFLKYIPAKYHRVHACFHAIASRSFTHIWLSSNFPMLEPITPLAADNLFFDQERTTLSIHQHNEICLE
jgi:hypothetical protein